jgi:hypothetical protein
LDITREQFAAYVTVQKSGVTNMMDVRRVSALSGLTPDQVVFIIRTYAQLQAKYGISG